LGQWAQSLYVVALYTLSAKLHHQREIPVSSVMQYGG
jgi:hypothetical protein